MGNSELASCVEVDLGSPAFLEHVGLQQLEFGGLGAANFVDELAPADRQLVGLFEDLLVAAGPDLAAWMVGWVVATLDLTGDVGPEGLKGRVDLGSREHFIALCER